MSQMLFTMYIPFFSLKKIFIWFKYDQQRQQKNWVAAITFKSDRHVCLSCNTYVAYDITYVDDDDCSGQVASRFIY